ncbi:hypothetical protein [Sphingomonas bacterium]|uniref:hypothetical protein n=1 Tax=Sphingomonas bacterium TaxID=1895847 RepID=UPI0020C66426|nr:hypothetical protein [Sphingomonas bacterium]
MMRPNIFVVGAIAAVGLSAGSLSAAPVRIAASARLAHCGEATCLLVTGRRADAAAPVSIAGHDIAVVGGRSWRVSLPLPVVQAWSAPAARTLSVEIGGDNGAKTDAALPIGLLGQITQLAYLDVNARR